MKTVVISGYYGYENIGDEALLASIITALRNELPELHIIVLSANPGQTAARYEVEAEDRMSLRAVFAALRKADLLISGGGSLLQDATGPLTIPYYLGIVALARLLGKKVMFYAQGIGPVTGSLGRMLIRLVADSVDLITLRDRASGDLLREIGVRRPPVEFTADPVFGLDADASHEAGSLMGEKVLPDGDGPLAGIFVRGWKDFAAYKKAIAETADYLCAKGWRVVFIPMQYPADVAPAGEIAGMMKNSPLVIGQKLNFQQVMGLMAETDLVIGMRLHALIIATICEVPMLGVSYDPKVTEFLGSIGQPVVAGLETLTAETLITQADTIINNLDAIKSQLSSIRQDLRGKALRNSRLALELLQK